MTDKNYNSNRVKLQLPEYGRNILEMVDILLTIDDREERNRMARIVIDVMGNINPHLRDSLDYKHKLWDHLFILSDFKLDIDSPYEKLTPDTLSIKPERIPYPKREFTHKQYGNNIRDVIQYLKGVDDEEEIRVVASDIAKFMKVKSYEYNQEYPSNEVIINDIAKFSDGEILLDENTLNGTKLLYNKPGKSVGRTNIRRNTNGVPQRNNNNNINKKQTGNRINKNGRR